jgi:hypothetical protein
MGKGAERVSTWNPSWAKLVFLADAKHVSYGCYYYYYYYYYNYYYY